MRPIILFLALGACAAPDEAPPASVQIQGNVIGTFHVLTSFDGDTPSTLLMMGVSELSAGCPALTLDTAAVDGAAMQPDEQGGYMLHVDDAAPEYVFDGARGAESIEATAASADPFRITYTTGGPGEPVHVYWTVDSSPDDVKVEVQVNGFVAYLADTGEVVVPGDAVPSSGDYDVDISKTRDTGWCTYYDHSGGENRGCCGSWSTEVTRRATVTVP